MLQPKITPRTASQQMMIDDGLPPGCLMTPQQRAEAWRGRRFRKIKETPPAKRKALDPGTAALLKERAAEEKRKKREAKAARKEKAIINKRRKVRRDAGR